MTWRALSSEGRRANPVEEKSRECGPRQNPRIGNSIPSVAFQCSPSAPLVKVVVTSLLPRSVAPSSTPHPPHQPRIQQPWPSRHTTRSPASKAFTVASRCSYGAMPIRAGFDGSRPSCWAGKLRILGISTGSPGRDWPAGNSNSWEGLVRPVVGPPMSWRRPKWCLHGFGEKGGVVALETW